MDSILQKTLGQNPTKGTALPAFLNSFIRCVLLEHRRPEAVRSTGDAEAIRRPNSSLKPPGGKKCHHHFLELNPQRRDDRSFNSIRTNGPLHSPGRASGLAPVLRPPFPAESKRQVCGGRAQCGYRVTWLIACPFGTACAGIRKEIAYCSR